METKRKALGKGLEQLFNAENLNFDQIESDIIQNTAKDEIVELPLSELRNNPYQPRKVFDEEALNELAASIRENGIFQPIIVKKSIRGYEIVAGERRVKASRQIGLETIPAIVRDFSDEEMMQIALLENLQREDLNAIEEANAYQTMLTTLKISQAELGQKLGKSRSHITNMIGLLKLPTTIQDMVLQQQLTMGHARVLSKLTDKERIILLARKIVNEGLSVRQLEGLVSDSKRTKKKGQTKINEYHYLESKMEEVLGSKVKITANKIQISFNSSVDLNRILKLIKLDLDR